MYAFTALDKLPWWAFSNSMALGLESSSSSTCGVNSQRACPAKRRYNVELKNRLIVVVLDGREICYQSVGKARWAAG
jgi:hypothetical protein